MTIMLLLARIIWLLVPGGVANATAAILARVAPAWNAPVDFGKSFAGNRVFGDHKTWRGLIGGTITGGAIFLLQRSLSSAPFFHTLELFDYKKAPWFLGFIIGFGALFGDLVKSFIKRRLAVLPGRPLFVFDQTDWVLGAQIALTPFIHLPLRVIFFSLVAGGLLHLAVKYLGYRIGLDDKGV